MDINYANGVLTYAYLNRHSTVEFTTKIDEIGWLRERYGLGLQEAVDLQKSAEMAPLRPVIKGLLTVLSNYPRYDKVNIDLILSEVSKSYQS